MSHFYPKLHKERLYDTFYRLSYSIILDSIPLTAEIAVTKEPVLYEDRLGLEYRPIHEGEGWGNTWDCAWVHITGRVPKEWAGAYVTLNLNFGGEILVFDEKGCPLLGMTNGSVFDGGFSKDHFHFLPKAKGGEKIDFWIDAGSNHIMGVNRQQDPAWEKNAEAKDGTYHSSIVACSVTRFDYDAWQLKIDLDVLQTLLLTMPEESGKAIRILRGISKALDLLPPERGGVKAVRKELQDRIFSIPPDPASIHVSAIGHAHIDTAWLWPIRETKRKVARTFSSQIGLIKRYPGYKFGASQPQLYKYCKEGYPKLFEKIKKAVAAGEWELQGGMWVEADCNIPSGESLIRQFLVGEHFYLREFGKTVRNLWLPDVFGYSGNLPQILKVCGIEFFLTQKLSWNKYNRFPHNTFVWEGIDGSQIVSHFPPEDTYNAWLTPNSLAKHETNNREAGIVDEAISLFGIGDGGGGPKEEMIENGLRVHALNGCPRVDFSFAQDAFDRIVKLKDELDVWHGELYFEMHRGTYTTQARQKMYNRRAEEALRVAEMLAAAADCGVKSAIYPREEFQLLWEDLLVCQFHDIIPGSSISRVYKECGKMVSDVRDKALAIAQKAGQSLLKKDAKSVSYFNASSTPFDGVVGLPLQWEGAVDGEGKVLKAQKEANGQVFAAIHVPAQSFATITRAGEGNPHALQTLIEPGERIILENQFVRYELDESLRIVNAYDKEANREFITGDAPANVLALYDDHPTEYDAWDVQEFALKMRVAVPKNVEIFAETGDARTSVYASFDLGGSHFTQQIRLAEGSKRLDFETQVDWQETHKICQTSFPVQVQNENATYEIQYGTIQRATHDNTKWQYAQFESCGHRYADLSDNDFGVALLNDSKYGYRVKGSVLTISLLRSPTYPDPYADKGSQAFTYAVMPHEGRLADSDQVVKAAAELNQGVLAFEGYAATAKSVLPISYEGEGVELAVLKKAEDSDALVVRLVERCGHHAKGFLKGIKGAKITPCLATELGDVGEPMNLSTELNFKPYEIKTFRVEKM